MVFEAVVWHGARCNLRFAWFSPSGLRPTPPLPSVGVAARFASLHLLEGFAHEH
jgi:hypothetical protein